MRKVKLQVQMSVDGFIAGPNGEMDWMIWNWDEALKSYTQEISDSFDTIILGRKLAQGFIPYWANVAADPENPDMNAGKKFTDTQKIVFTKTLQPADPEVMGWANASLAKDDLVKEIDTLKNKDGKDIIAYGGATFVSSLIKEKLIDEFHLFINPTAIGNGMPIFRELQNIQQFTLKKASSFECGIVVLHYVKKE